MIHSVHIVCDPYGGFQGILSDEYGNVVNRIDAPSLDDALRSLALAVGRPLVLELRGLNPDQPDRRGLCGAVIL